MGKQNSQQNQNLVPQIHLSARELTTRFQVETALSILNMTASTLRHLTILDDEAHQPDHNSEARICAENTMRAACERLDKMLTEDSRWTTEFQDKIEKQADDSYQLQMSLLQEQKAAANEINSPHFRYRPTILHLVDGSWAAFLGDMDNMEQGIVGTGQSPQEAIDSFDDAFKGIANPKMLEWLKQREHHLEAGTQCPPFPSESNEEKRTKLDGDGNQEPQSPAKSGEDPVGNS